MQLLLIDRHASEAAPLAKRLAAEGMRLDFARTASDAKDMMAIVRYDLAVVDLSPPNLSARTLLMERETGAHIPMIVLMPEAALTGDQRNLLSHADDWMPKPVAVPELIARIRTVHGRASGAGTRVLRAGGLAVSPEARRATFHGTPIVLSPREFTILALLVRHAAHPVPRAMLVAAAYGHGTSISANAVEAVMSRLRRALKAAGCRVRILAVRGVGWRLVVPQHKGGLGR